MKAFSTTNALKIILAILLVGAAGCKAPLPSTSSIVTTGEAQLVAAGSMSIPRRTPFPHIHVPDPIQALVIESRDPFIIEAPRKPRLHVLPNRAERLVIEDERLRNLPRQ